MISIKDLISDKTPYSTTRWAFVVCVIVGIVMAFITLITSIVLLFLGKSIEGLISGSVALIGIIVGLPTGAKALQGFERNHDEELRKDNNDNEKGDIA